MNRDGNAYTFIYAIIMVVVVAAILSFAALSLKPIQQKNVEIAKKSDILKSVNIASTADDAEAKYDKFITETFVVNSKGKRVETDAFKVDLKKELNKDVAERNLPVYVCTTEGGETKYILPMRGKGLWGPIWGYIAVNEDKQTVYGATFDHKGETPGLGAEISKDFFTNQFKNKKILDGGEARFVVLKSGAASNEYAVDGISGGTITSKGLEEMVIESVGAYEAFLNN